MHVHQKLALSAVMITASLMTIPTCRAGTMVPTGKSAALLCDKKMKVYSFVVDATGNVSDTGRSIEGPACIQVYFPGVQYKASLSQATTTSKGPDGSTVVMGTAGTSGSAPETKTPPPPTPLPTLQSVFKELADKEDALRKRLVGIEGRYASAVADQDAAVKSIKQMLQDETGVDPVQMPKVVKSGYGKVQPFLKKALSDQNFVPTDQASSEGPAALSALQLLATDLGLLRVRFADGTKWDAANSKCNEDAASRTPSIAFSEWYAQAQCKGAYDTLTQQVNADVQGAQAYTSSSDKVSQLKSKLAIVKYWDLHFADMGLQTTMTDQQINDTDIAAAFSTAIPVRCGTLFNMNSSTAVSVVTIDQTPTLDGNNPTVKVQPSFVTVTCASPLSVSAGIAFSTIEQKEFAIIKSAGGANNTSVNKFGTINDSRLHPMPIGIVHVRLADWDDHKYAFHASFGVAGNIKGQGSGGSAAEFLPGVGLSFWRTMFLTFGPHIGTKSELAGGFKEGDLVPSDVTNIQGQVKRSYTVGFGFAITFTKP